MWGYVRGRCSGGSFFTGENVQEEYPDPDTGLQSPRIAVVIWASEINIQTDTQTARQTDTQTARQTDTQTARQTAFDKLSQLSPAN